MHLNTKEQSFLERESPYLLATIHLLKYLITNCENTLYTNFEKLYVYALRQAHAFSPPRSSNQIFHILMTSKKCLRGYEMAFVVKFWQGPDNLIVYKPANNHNVTYTTNT